MGAGESIVPPMAMEQILTAMAASVLHSASGMSSWGMADLTLGLYKVWNRHTLEKAVDTIKGVPVDNV
jgi:sn1-specific diacylglycerol lipase